MKVLLVNCVYKNGSTGKIVADIHRELSDNNIESVVCYGRGAKVSEPNVYKTCGEWYSKLNNLLSRITGIMYGGCFFSTSKLISRIKKERPDIVHLHCLNGYFVNIYRILHWLKKEKIKTVLTLHAEFMYTGGCGHAFDCEKWCDGNECRSCGMWRQETKSLIFKRTHSMWARLKKVFYGFDNLIVISVSDWLKERAEKSIIFADKNHKVILNGLDIDIFRWYGVSELRNKYAIHGEKIVFHATPDFSDDVNSIKGGCYVIELAKLNPEISFIVAGPYKKDIVLPKNVILLGKIKEQINLAKLYSMADVTLLTSKKETFSMVTVESLCCGTPVVGFKAGGPERIAIKEFCKFVDYADIMELNAELKSMLNYEWDKLRISSCAHEKYSKTKMAERYIKIYGELIKQNEI